MILLKIETKNNSIEIKDETIKIQWENGDSFINIHPDKLIEILENEFKKYCPKD